MGEIIFSALKIWSFGVFIFADITEGFFKRADYCVEKVTMIGCNGSLLNSFTPTSKAVALHKANTMVFLFTPENPDKAEFLHLCDGRLPANSKYDPTAETEIFIHGWLDGVCRRDWMREMLRELAIRGRYNCILVDWTWGSFMDPFTAVINTKVVGEQIAFVIRNIMEQKILGPEKFHIVGHSFGVMCASRAGDSVRVGRITGLDPAIVILGDYQPELNFTQAELVDIIHTNEGIIPGISLGNGKPLGHADFYLNGGTIQLSCYSSLLASLYKKDFLTAILSLYPPACFHFQAIQYYKESINAGSNPFIGVECKSGKDFEKGCSRVCKEDESNCAVMGMDYGKCRMRGEKGRKTYYLKTKLREPFVDNEGIDVSDFPISDCTKK